MRGEKIDIVPYIDDHVQYVCGALSPAKVGRVYMDEDSRSMEVIVPDDQLSLAIGKGGQNVRLAARLTGWKIDVKSDSMTEGHSSKEYESLLQISGMDEATAEILYKEGLKDINILASADPELISLLPTIEGLSKEKLSLWIDEAANILARENDGHDA